MMYISFSAVHPTFNTPVEIALYQCLLKGDGPRDRWPTCIETETLRSLYHKKNLRIIE